MRTNFRARGEGILPLLIVVLAIFGAAIWYLESSRRNAEHEARAFAAQVAESLAVRYDTKSLSITMSPDARGQHPFSWRERLVNYLRDFGHPIQPIPIEGDVQFTSYFFDPHGKFTAKLTYPKRSAQLQLGVSHGLSQWQLDDLNLVWNPDPKEAPF